MAREKVDVDHYPGDASRECSCVALCPTPTGHAALIGFPWVPCTCKDGGDTNQYRLLFQPLKGAVMGPQEEEPGATERVFWVLKVSF